MSDAKDVYEQLVYVPAHCDSRVLHPPKYCEYCDHYPEAQQKRVDLGVNFTGPQDDALLPCPAVDARGLDNLYGWGGNSPRGPNVPRRDKMALRKMERLDSRAFYGNYTTWQDYRHEFSESPQDEDRPGNTSG